LNAELISRETIAHTIFISAAWLSAGFTLMIFGFMAVLGYPILRDGQLFKMLTGPWSPIHQSYGIWPMIIGTLAIASLGLILAVPLSLGCAILIQVVAPRGFGHLLHKLVHLMTGIPTVIYGFVGIFLLVPLVREIFGHGSGLCILSASLMLALLISPTMILFFVQGLARVPRAYLMAVTAMGGTPIQRLVYVMLPNAWRSILAGLILSFGRAVGDTMIALMLAGNAVATPQSLLDSARTLTAHIALVIAADFDSLEFRSLFICGLILYLFTSLATLTMRWMVTNHMQRP
jgi:phosphate transport system permease protein